MSQAPACALLSVTDKTNLIPFARGLQALGYTLLSTGGTARLLTEAGLTVREVAAHTGSPELLDGRVKTLHPKIHAGILYDRDNDSHRKDLASLGVEPIDIVVVNLYQFAEQTQARQLSAHEAIEFIDIGGPCMLRAAAKNFQSCLPVMDPADYERCLAALQTQNVSHSFRQELAAKVFRKISLYDALIADFLEAPLPETVPLPAHQSIALERVQELRYGENPHQKAAFYRRKDAASEGGLNDAQVLQGKELSYNNLLDCDAAARIVADFPENCAVAIIKHTNPCGAALARPGDSLCHTFQRALAADPKSAFGGIVATNRPLDGETADAMAPLFLECIVAPSFSPEALDIFAKKKNLRVLELPWLALGKARKDTPDWNLRSILGGILIQQDDTLSCDPHTWRVVTERPPSPQEIVDLTFAMRLCKHVKSNAIVYAHQLASVAIGAGQMSRIDAARFAAEKAKECGHTLKGSVLASDAFFPFRDTVDLAASLGVSAIVQPGGSLRDQESIDAANAQGLAMTLTGVRHFKH